MPCRKGAKTPDNGMVVNQGIASRWANEAMIYSPAAYRRLCGVGIPGRLVGMKVMFTAACCPCLGLEASDAAAC